MALGISNSVSPSLIPTNFQKPPTAAASLQMGVPSSTPEKAGVLASRPPKGYRFEPCLLHDEVFPPGLRAFDTNLHGVKLRTLGFLTSIPTPKRSSSLEELGSLKFTNKNGQQEVCFVFRTNEDLGPVPKGSLIYSGKFGAFATLGTSPVSPVKTNYGTPRGAPPPETIDAVTVGQVGAGILDAQGIADWGRSITFSPHKDAGQMKACQGQ